MNFFITIFRKLVNLTGYEITSLSRIQYLESESRLPKPTLSALQLVFAWLFQSGKATNLTFLQIGACDGKTGDDSFLFVQQGIMHSYLIEPNSDSFSALEKNYQNIKNVTCVHCAISLHDGEETMYSVSGIEHCQIASFDRTHLEKHLDQNQRRNITSNSVKVLTYDSLLEKLNIDHVDVVVIDAEGYDKKIIEMILQSERKLPKILYFENLHLTVTDSKSIFKKLRKDYEWIHDDWNTLTVRSDFVQNIS